MRDWRSPGTIQKGYFADTVVCFDPLQRGDQLSLSTGSEVDVFRRIGVWVAEEHFNILIRGNPLCAATDNGDDRGCC